MDDDRSGTRTATLVQTFAAMGVDTAGLRPHGNVWPRLFDGCRKCHRHPASTGKAFFHTEIMIADDDGNEVPRGTAGGTSQGRAHHGGVLESSGSHRRDH